MNITPVTVPKIIKRLFPNFIWDISTQDKELFLTFDDGPTPIITDWVLDCLKDFNAKATFFCIGKNIELYPKIYYRILKENHGIGNHTFNHLNGWKTKTSKYIKDIEDIRASTNSVRSYLFRPPYGRITPRQSKLLRNNNFKIIMWSVLSLDWDESVSNTRCLDYVIKNSKSGSIIVFHDSEKAVRNMKYALPAMLDYFSKKGYCFKSIPESIQ